MVAHKAFGPLAAIAVVLAFCTISDALVFSRPGPPGQRLSDWAGLPERLLVRALPPHG